MTSRQPSDPRPFEVWVLLPERRPVEVVSLPTPDGRVFVRLELGDATSATWVSRSSLEEIALEGSALEARDRFLEMDRRVELAIDEMRATLDAAKREGEDGAIVRDRILDELIELGRERKAARLVLVAHIRELIEADPIGYANRSKLEIVAERMQEELAILESGDEVPCGECEECDAGIRCRELPPIDDEEEWVRPEEDLEMGWPRDFPEHPLGGSGR